MDQTTFEGLCRIAYDEAGISMGEAKRQLVTARVGKRLRALGLPDAKAYLRHLKLDRAHEEIPKFLDVITTNFTSFYREPDHFEELTAYVRSPAVRGETVVWCAAAATGEEPYTLALTLNDALGGNHFRILATDISTRALARCREGVYSEQTVETVPKRLLSQHFSATGDGNFRVHDALKSRIAFARLNLAKPPFPMQGPMHAVFIRNVMIYFDRPVRQALISEAERMLVPGGMLFVGHAETLSGLKTGLEVVRPSVYRKPAATMRRAAGMGR